MSFAKFSTAALALIAFTSTAQAATHRITISNLAFKPAAIAAQIGDTIEWVNADVTDHTATAKDGSFDVSVPKGTQKSVTLSKAGTINYYCRIHASMKGQITVKAK